jgi:hypothetical protein
VTRLFGSFPLSIMAKARARNAAFEERNFAKLDPDTVSELGRIGGFIAQRSGKAHKLTRKERSRGGRLGGRK